MRTVDTDVVIILLGKFSLLHKIINSDAAIWVALGTGRNFKYLQGRIERRGHATLRHRNLYCY